MRGAFLVAGVCLALTACDGRPALDSQAVVHDSQATLFELPAAAPSGPPSYALRFLAQAQREPARWEGRLLERDEHGHVQPWAWRILVPGDPDPRLVYAEREYPPTGVGEAFVEVRLRDGDWLAREPVSSTRGAATEVLEMTLQQVAVFGGKVQDAAGQPLGDAELRLQLESASGLEPLMTQPLITWSDAQGNFLFGGVEPGQHHLRVRSEGRADVHLDLTLEAGSSDGLQLGMLNCDELTDLPIALLGPDPEAAPMILLTLRGRNGQHVWRSVHSGSQGTGKAEIHREGVGVAILFPDLPLGNYDLSVLGLDGQRYEPSPRKLSFAQLSQGVVLRALPAGARHELRFRLRDEQTGQLISGAGVRFSAPGWWPPERILLAPDGLAAVLPANASTPDWMIVREGYRPLYGTFAPPADLLGEWLEERTLRAGWGCELIFRDGSERLPRPSADSWTRSAAIHMAQPLAGVRVLADGVLQGRSDERGLLRLELDQRPARLVFEREGWRELPAICTGFLDAHDTRLLARTGAAIVWLDKSP